MQTKLTLRMEERLIRQAKAYARRTGKSVSGLVAGFFSQLSTAPGPPPETGSPAVRSLVGALGGMRVDEDDYRAYLIRKHR